MAPNWKNAWSGTNSYHPGTNRAFTVDSKNSTTYCFDFNVENFRVRIVSPDGDVVLPEPPDEWHDLLDGPLDLDGLPAFDHLIVEFDIAIDPDDNPFVSGNPPTFHIIGEAVGPHLTS